MVLSGVLPPDPAVLTVGEVRDRAQVFINRQPVGVLARDHHETSLPLPAGARGRLEILVEDQSQVDYGPRIGEPKGLIGPVSIGGETAGGWTARGIVMEKVADVAARLRRQPETATGELAGPAFARGRERADHHGTAGRPRGGGFRAPRRSRPHRALIN
jgi:beta-galactosidase